MNAEWQGIQLRIGTTAYAMGLAVVSLLPSGGGGSTAAWDVSISSQLQDAMHVVAYGILVVLSVRRSDGRGPSWRDLLSAGVCTWVFGFSLELLQRQVPGRYATISDLARNTLGVGLGLVLLVVWRWSRATRSKETGE